MPSDTLLPMPESSPPPLPPSQKGWSALAWIGLGCAGLLISTFVILIIAVLFFSHKAMEYARKVEKNPARAAAELFVKVNPDVELVSVDDEAGTMTIRIKETGKTATVTYADIAQGKFSVVGEEGEFRVDANQTDGSANVTVKRTDGAVSYVSGSEAASKTPAWVLTAAYPGAAPPQAAFAVEARGALSGSLGTATKDDLQKVAQYYRGLLQREGYQVTENAPASEASKMIYLSGRKEAEGQTLVIVCSETAEGTQIFLSFDEAPDRKQP